jgi:hypothetical protein
MRCILTITDSIKNIRWPVLLTLTVALILVLGALTARSVVRAMDRDGGNSTAGSASIPSSIEPLLAGENRAEPGDVVFLNKVRLQAGPKPGIVIVSSDKGTRMLVIWQSAGSTAAQPPSVANIEGQVRRLPSAAVLRKDWKLNNDEIRSFSQQQIYIAAEYIKGRGPEGKSDKGE